MSKDLKIIFAIILLLCLHGFSCFKPQEKTVTGAGEPLFSVTGRVVDIDNSRPLAGAILTIRALELADTANADGGYKFENLKIGQREVQVVISEYEPIILVLDLVDYQNRDIVHDFQMIKKAQILLTQELPFENPSGIWYENGQFFITSYDELGGSIYRLSQNLIIQKSNLYFVNWLRDSCISHIDSTQVIWPPGSHVYETVYEPCSKRLYGLTRVGDYIYTCNGGTFQNNTEQALENMPHFLYRIHPQNLVLQNTIELNGFQSGTFKVISDLAWTGQSLWLCDSRLNVFAKLWTQDLLAQSVVACTIPHPNGIAWDGRYLWVSSGEMIYQLNATLAIRNRYRVKGFYLGQMTWDGEAMWVVRDKTRMILKLGFPFQDHF